jgi:DNA-binding NarL/FixJ family response regulator
LPAAPILNREGNPMTLTKRESEVAAQVARGLSNREIATALMIAEGTVKAHLHQVYNKLQVQSRVQLVLKTGSPD